MSEKAQLSLALFIGTSRENLCEKRNGAILPLHNSCRWYQSLRHYTHAPKHRQRISHHDGQQKHAHRITQEQCKDTEVTKRRPQESNPGLGLQRPPVFPLAARPAPTSECTARVGREFCSGVWRPNAGIRAPSNVDPDCVVTVCMACRARSAEGKLIL